jgi:hypothetical protein
MTSHSIDIRIVDIEFEGPLKPCRLGPQCFFITYVLGSVADKIA